MDKRRGSCITFFCRSLCLAVPKNFGEQLFCVSEKNRISKKFTDNKGTSLLTVDIFLFHSAEKFRAETLRCFRKFLISQFFFDKRRGRLSGFFSKVLSHSTEKIRRATLLCFRKNLVSKNVLNERRGVCITIFVKVCVSQYQKKSWGNPSVFQKKSSLEKIYA